MAEQQQNDRQLAMQKIYLRDASVEVPSAPVVFTKKWEPKVNINMNSAHKEISDNTYEVTLTVEVTAELDGETAFLVEVQQAGIFAVTGFNEEEMGPLLGSYCPNTLFPFAREAIDGFVGKAGFPQMLLQPVNFDALYAQSQQQAADSDTKH